MKDDIMVPEPGVVPEILTSAWNEMVASKKFQGDSGSHWSRLRFHPVIYKMWEGFFTVKAF